MAPSKSHLILFLVFLFASPSAGEKKTKKGKGDLEQPPHYEIHPTPELPSDKQVSTFLLQGENKTFSYDSAISNAPLSMTVITCTSPINWIVRLRVTNGSTDDNKGDLAISNLTTPDIQTLHMTSSKGRYFLQVTATNRNSYVHIYVSTEPGGPQALQRTQAQDVLKLLKRQQKKKLTIRWSPSLVDPQGTDYCLVLSTKSHHQTLCSAQGLDSPPQLKNKPSPASQIVTAWNDKQKIEKQREPRIFCSGPRTHLTLDDCRHGQTYYFDLFAINKQSNLTYLYGTGFTIFDKRTKPIRLKDNKSTYVNLKKYDGKVVFRYKVGKLLSDSLKLYVTPCGGAVDVEVNLKGEIVSNRRRIEGFERLIIQNPPTGARYYIKILSSNREELRRISGVEILATTKPLSIVSLPSMPSERSVQEYSSLRKCDSVTVGWLASPGPRVARYCLVVTEGPPRERDAFKMPNQCGLESRLKKSADFAVKHCKDVKQENEQVVTQTIRKLRPGKSYVVQVTVKKPKGKTLSYDLLQVHTKPECEGKTRPALS